MHKGLPTQHSGSMCDGMV